MMDCFKNGIFRFIIRGVIMATANFRLIEGNYGGKNAILFKDLRLFILRREVENNY